MDTCYVCGEEVALDNQFNFTAANDTTRNQRLVCRNCADYSQRCTRCRTITRTRFIVEPANWSPGRWCNVCTVNDAAQCVLCTDYFESVNDDGECSACELCGCGDCGCDRCYPDGGGCGEYDCSQCETHIPSPYSVMHGYSFKPTPMFFDLMTGNYKPTPGTPYLGMELEIGINDYETGAKLLTKAAPDLIYCKEDGSVSGLEMVTHPMTLEAAKRLIPFSTLRTLRNEYRASAYNYGIHVHVSRDGFSDDLHVLKWFKLLYRNADDVKRIARRDARNWAAFDHHERENQKYTAEKVRSEKTLYAGPHRYSAINVLNSATFEVRVFRGSLRKDEILASLELVDASVEYCRQLSTTEIMLNHGWSWGKFIKWAGSQGDKYRHLLLLNGTPITTDRDMEEAA